MVRKTFGFDHTYVLTVATSVLYKGAEIFAPPAWPSGFGEQSRPSIVLRLPVQQQHPAPRATAAVFFRSSRHCDAITGGDTIPGPFQWAGPSDQYFAAVFLPDDPASAAMITLRNSIPVLRDPHKPDSKETVNLEVFGAAVGSLHGPTLERMYVGPKELSSIDPSPYRRSPAPAPTCAASSISALSASSPSRYSSGLSGPTPTSFPTGAGPSSSRPSSSD